MPEDAEVIQQVGPDDLWRLGRLSGTCFEVFPIVDCKVDAPLETALPILRGVR